jgi:hypothetical protein
MPGLVPGIHVFATASGVKTWMAGTGPAMIIVGVAVPAPKQRPYHLNSRVSARGGWPNSSFTDAGSS